MKLIIAMGICLTPWCAFAGGGAAYMQGPPAVHRFFDRRSVAIHTVSMIMMEADVLTSVRALQAPGTREANPMAQGQAALISLKIGGAAAGLGIAYAMHRTGHHKAERIIPLIFGLPSGIAAIHNAGIHR